MKTIDAQVRTLLLGAFRVAATTDAASTHPSGTAPVLSHPQFEWLVRTVADIAKRAESGALVRERGTIGDALANGVAHPPAQPPLIHTPAAPPYLPDDAPMPIDDFTLGRNPL